MLVFKGVVHLHSTYSHDATLSLPTVRDLLKGRGYHFGLMAEHHEDLDEGTLAEFIDACADLSDEGFLLIPGIEFHTRCLAACGVTMPAAFGPGEAERLANCYTEGTFNVLVHPSGVASLPDVALLRKVDAVEVWNVKADGGRYPAGRRIALWKRLRREYDVHPVVGIDLHDESQLASVHVRLTLPELTTPAVLSAMKAGDYRLYHGDRVCPVDVLPFGMKLGMLGNGVMRTTAGGLRRMLGWALPRGLRKRIRMRLDGVKRA